MRKYSPRICIGHLIWRFSGINFSSKKIQFFVNLLNSLIHSIIDSFYKVCREICSSLFGLGFFYRLGQYKIRKSSLPWAHKIFIIIIHKNFFDWVPTLNWEYRFPLKIFFFRFPSYYRHNFFLGWNC
jgi:hypothetical protein